MNQPIGMIDSGVGGVSVLFEALRLLPEERFLFEKIQGTGHLAFGLDKHYLAFVGQHGQVVDFFFGKWCSASCV